MKKLLVISGKGGTGKTTVASALIRMSKAKAMADCDVDAPNLHIINSFEGEPQRKDYIGEPKAYINQVKCISCGICYKHCRFSAIIRKSGKFKINEYACEGCGVCEYVCPKKAITMIPDTSGTVNVYSGERTFSTAELKIGRGNSGKLVTEVKKELFENAKDAEIAVLDGSPGVGCPVMASISGVDLCLIVTEPTESGKSDLERIAQTVSRSFVKAAVCINKYDLNTGMSEKIEQWCKANAIPFVGKIPYDSKVSKAVNKGKSIYEYNSPASTALEEIYKNIKELMDGEQNDS